MQNQSTDKDLPISLRAHMPKMLSTDDILIYDKKYSEMWREAVIASTQDDYSNEYEEIGCISFKDEIIQLRKQTKIINNFKKDLKLKKNKIILFFFIINSRYIL